MVSWLRQIVLVPRRRRFSGRVFVQHVTAPWRPRDACWIVNDSPSSSPEVVLTGWRAGLPPHAQLENNLMGSTSDPHPHIDRWLARMGVETVVNNDRDLQSVASEVWGLYACWFAAHGLPQLNPGP